jgi:hypothetical protein
MRQINNFGNTPTIFHESLISGSQTRRLEHRSVSPSHLQGANGTVRYLQRVEVKKEFTKLLQHKTGGGGSSAAPGQPFESGKAYLLCVEGA